MSDWLLSLDGAQASRWALAFALMSAFFHASFGALQKGRHDPWLMRGSIDLSYSLMAWPFALFVVPWPEPHMWVIFGVMFCVHMAYKFALAMAYARAAYTVVYPITRGVGPLVTVLAAGVIFAETYTVVQWAGVLLLSAAIFGLAWVNYRVEVLDRRALAIALGFAFLTGVLVAAYTTWDAYGIRATADPLTFVAWFFAIDGLGFPLISYAIWRRMPDRPPLWPILRRGVVGGVFGIFSFSGVMLATRLDKVGEAAVLRETSTVFAALIGWLVLRERMRALHAVLMILIAVGAVLVEVGR